jgi:predicted DNA-binding protein
MMQFQDMATPEEKKLMDHYLEEINDYKAAWELLKQVTHADLE